MRLARNVALAALAAVLVLTGAAWAQVVKQLPSTTLAVLKVSDLDATNKKVADLAGLLGITQMQPEMADPLGAFLKKIGVTQGVNRSGELAFAYVDGAAYNNVDSDKSELLLIPVSDYQQFIGNFPDAKANADVTEVHFKDETDSTFVAHWGDYAAASPSMDIVAKPPTEMLEVKGLAAKEMDGKDIVFFGNIKALRVRALAAIDKARQEAATQIDQGVQQNPKIGQVDITPFTPVLKVVVTQMLNVAQELVQDTNAVTYGVNLSSDGIGTTMLADFEPDSPAAKHVAAMKNTDASLLAGLPDGKYLVFGGSQLDPKDLSQVASNLLAPIQAAITALGPEYSSLNDCLNGFLKMNSATTGGAFGLLAPTAALGQGSLLQVIALRTGDAKAILASTHDMFDAQKAAMKALGAQPAGTSQTYVAAAKTLDGVTFDEYQGSFAVDPNAAPQVQQMVQVMKMVYGPLGQVTYVGVVNDQTFLGEMGLDDATLSAAIAAAKSGDDPLAKMSGVKTAAAQLPGQRIMAVYFPLDLWASTGLGYAKQFGMDMGVTLPDNLPPIGATLSSDDTALRVDGYVPSQLLQALTAAGMQIYMKTQGGMGGPGAPGGAAPGGAAPGGL